MKLIITGATGFVATEVIRQSLSNRHITSVIALARGPVAVPANLSPGADVSKMQSVAIADYGSYSDDLKKHFADADACIWTVAITPGKAKSIPFEEVRRVCHSNTLAGLKAMMESRPDAEGKAAPFRFMYMSGIGVERDQSKTPRWGAKYSLMRGETETQVLALAAEQRGKLEVCIAKPGLIVGQGEYLKYVAATVMNWTGIVPYVGTDEIAAAMLDQVIKGFTKDTIESDELSSLGRQALKQSE